MATYDLSGKVALVTGAARGIGFETAQRMHARGASVAVVDLDAGEAREAAERIGERAVGIGADVTDAGAMLAAVAETVERFGGLDLAMANAGIAPEGSTTRTMPAEEWERVIDVDLLGVWNTVRAALPQISERNGQIVIVASVAAFMNGMMLSPYAASKAAVEALGRSLRVELAPWGASATVAYFGWVETEMVRQGLDREQGGRRIQELLPKFFFKRIRVEEAATALVDGIEARAPRVFAPRWWRYVSALRGVLGPVLDHRMARDAKIAAALRQAEADKAAKSAT
ncbi:MAG TPA: short-chain dehydrogenase/reductase [Solirubrobacterales bacterium]|nr:short-chain dehydrogenase/reductase [Solirubrobacterales bacterium]